MHQESSGVQYTMDADQVRHDEEMRARRHRPAKRYVFPEVHGTRIRNPPSTENGCRIKSGMTRSTRNTQRHSVGARHTHPEPIGVSRR
jgi:hypothetical protein